jgi:O-acetyl-ADP-ribose deacetylase (regulator of RNase III)
MRLINTYEIEYNDRYIPIEIYHGDLTKLDEKVDVLVVSAFKGGYNPVEKTLLGALNNNLKISIKELSKNPSIDLRDALNCWITDGFKSNYYSSIMTVEMRDYLDKDSFTKLDHIFRDMFIALSVISQKGIKIRTIALPILGTGLQKIDFNKVINALIINLKKALESNISIERVLFVERDERKALKLSDSLDFKLNRVSVKLPVNDVIIDVKKNILKLVNNHSSKAYLNGRSYNYLKNTFTDDNSKSFNYGIVSRRLVENLLTKKYFLSEQYKMLSFFKKIQMLSEMRVANWIVSYLHVIRIFGNESAHDFSNNRRHPNNIDSKDITLLLFCVQRVVEFLVSNDDDFDKNR